MDPNDLEEGSRALPTLSKAGSFMDTKTTIDETSKPTVSPYVSLQFSHMRNVYKYLSHHYCLKRSVVFIVDTDYSSQNYKWMANNYVKTFFKNMLPTDCFGYIHLGKSSENQEVMLEPKSKNTYIKKLFLKSMADIESDLFFLGDRARLTRQDRLEKALEKALDWQMTKVEDKKVVINNHPYYDPHKWIVCLIGSDIFPVSGFLL